MQASFKSYLKEFKSDFPSGIVVFLVAIPLCLGIALASGAPLFSGIIAGIVGGIVVGSLSGSHLSVSGPAAGLTVIVLNAINQLGSFEAFLTALVLAGILQLVAGYFKAGIIGHYFPSSVIKGMLAAIGIILILKQFPHFVGLHTEAFGALEFNEADGTNTFTKFSYALTHINPLATFVGLIALGIIILWELPFIKRNATLAKIPGALIAVSLSILIPFVAVLIDPNFIIAKEQLVNLPFLFEGDAFSNSFALPDWSALGNYNVYIAAVTIAIIASLETLLSVEAVDKLDPHKRRTPNNQELKAQGIGNLISGLIGGLPLTAVIVRSTANLSSGAKTKMSAVYHGILLLVAVLFIPHVLNLIPLSALAAILLFVGYKLAKPALIKEQWKLGKNQFIPFIVTIIAILLTDLLVGIIIGLTVGAFFILLSNYELPFSVIEASHPLDGNKMIQIKLSEHVSFLNKASVQHTLEKIESNSEVIIDGTGMSYIDHDVLEVLYDFKEVAKDKYIDLTFKNIPDLHSSLVTTTTQSHNHDHSSIQKVLRHNRTWIANKLHTDPKFFDKLDEGQTPEILWIGCSDSRVVPNLITGLDAGDIFVHRNIANQVSDKDVNAQSVIEYAVNFLKVKNVVICGHYNCGGVKAALSPKMNNVIDHWIENLRQLADSNQADLNLITNETNRVNRLVELNVISQMNQLHSIPSIKNAIESKQLEVHGWVFDLKSGALIDLNDQYETIYPNSAKSSSAYASA